MVEGIPLKLTTNPSSFFEILCNSKLLWMRLSKAVEITITNLPKLRLRRLFSVPITNLTSVSCITVERGRLRWVRLGKVVGDCTCLPQPINPRKFRINLSDS